MRQITKLSIGIVVIVVIIVGAFAYLTYGSGTLLIVMKDPPSNWGSATQIYINYSAIEVHRADAGNESGWFTAVDSTAWINLTRTLDVNQTIGQANLQAGKYNLIRFEILEVLVTIGSNNYTATVPSDQLKIAITRGGVQNDLQINAGQTSTLLIDLNIAVHGSTEAGFMIVPDIRATPE